MQEKNILRLDDLQWRKWYRVDDNLSVALETSLPAGALPEYGLDMAVRLPNEMIYRAKESGGTIGAVVSRAMKRPVGRETVDRHYHPQVISESKEGFAAFKVHIVNGLFKRIVLWKDPSRKVRVSMWCGREKEFKKENQDKVFGFDSVRSTNAWYVPLSYPGEVNAGETPRFEPVFIKVSVVGLNSPYYLKVGAYNTNDDLVAVHVSKVLANQVPNFLKKVF